MLVHGGRACISVANVGRRPYLPLSAFITADMMEVGFLMRGQIIWNKQASAGASCAWGSRPLTAAFLTTVNLTTAVQRGLRWACPSAW